MADSHEPPTPSATEEPAAVTPAAPPEQASPPRRSGTLSSGTSSAVSEAAEPNVPTTPTFLSHGTLGVAGGPIGQLAPRALVHDTVRAARGRRHLLVVAGSYRPTCARGVAGREPSRVPGLRLNGDRSAPRAEPDTTPLNDRLRLLQWFRVFAAVAILAVPVLADDATHRTHPDRGLLRSPDPRARNDSAPGDRSSAAVRRRDGARGRRVPRTGHDAHGKRQQPAPVPHGPQRARDHLAPVASNRPEDRGVVGAAACSSGHAAVRADVFSSTQSSSDRDNILGALGFLVVALAAAAFSAVNERGLRASRGHLAALVDLDAELGRTTTARDIVTTLARSTTRDFGFARVAIVVSHDDGWLRGVAGADGIVEVVPCGPPTGLEAAVAGEPRLVRGARPARDPRGRSARCVCPSCSSRSKSTARCSACSPPSGRGVECRQSRSVHLPAPLVTPRSRFATMPLLRRSNGSRRTTR